MTCQQLIGDLKHLQNYLNFSLLDIQPSFLSVNQEMFGSYLSWIISMFLIAIISLMWLKCLPSNHPHTFFLGETTGWCLGRVWRIAAFCHWPWWLPDVVRNFISKIISHDANKYCMRCLMRWEIPLTSHVWGPYITYGLSFFSLIYGPKH